MQYKSFLNFNLASRQSVLIVIAVVAMILAGCVAESSGKPMPAQSSLKPLIDQAVDQTKEVLFEDGLLPPPTCSLAEDAENIVSEIVIGVLLPLTESPAMQAGLAMQAAVEIALDDVNHDGVLERPIRTITYDTQGSPATGREMAEKLILEDCAAAIVGVYHSRVGVAVKDVAHQYGVPVIFAEPYRDSITADKYPEVFRIAPTTQLTTQTYVDWLDSVADYNQDELRSVVIIGDNSNFESSKGQLIAQQLNEDELNSVETFLVDLPTEDFSSVIARIIALDNSPDVILIWFNGDAGYNFHQQLIEAGARTQGRTLVVMRSAAIDSTVFWERVPEGLHTIVAQVGPWHSTVSDMGKDFAEAYQEQAERWPESYAFEAYDSVRLVAAAIEEAGTLDASAIIESLESIDVVLASGRYHFPYGSKNVPDGEDVPDFMWHQWPDPHILFLQYETEAQDASDMPVLWPEKYSTLDRSALYSPSE